MGLAGQTVVVVGLGASGRAAARVCARRGARVIGVDVRAELPDADALEAAGITLQLGPHDRDTFLSADRIVVSPGVPARQPDVVAAEAAGIPVQGELGLAAELLAPFDPVIVGITGTNGKSTVTHFTGQLLAAAGRRPFVGGNLGDPVCNAVPDPGETPDWDVIVAECSSYQLERPGSLHVSAGTILNLSEDHLARHGTMAGYAAAKARLFTHVRPDDLVLAAPDALVQEALDAVLAGRPHRRATLGALPGLSRHGSTATLQLPGGDAVSLDLGALRIPGAHNLDNAATAALLAMAVGASVDVIQQAIPGLTALEHRMEVVHRGEVTWINDSKATNLDAARVGLSGLAGTAVVLLGGESKGPGFAALAPLLRRHRAVLTFGQDGPSIADELEGEGIAVERLDRMEEAILRARELAQPGDVVLLSPGCASFDHYDNFAVRGRIFRERVQAIFAEEEAP